MNLSGSCLDITGWSVLLAFTGTTLSPFAATAFGAPAAAPQPSPPPTAAASWTPPSPVYSRQPRAVAAPQVAAPSLKTQLAAAPNVDELRKFRALGRSLIAMPGRTASERHRSDTARMLENYVARAHELPSVRLQVLLEHLRTHPDSPFALSLWLELSSIAQKSANFALALQAAREAWQIARGVQGKGEALKEAESVLANLATLCARLGQRRGLSDLLAEIIGRPPHPASSSPVAQARAALAGWERDPELAAMCGIQAYNVLARISGAPLLHKPTLEWVQLDETQRELERVQLAEHGLSAARLVERVRASGSDWRWIKRVTGTTIPFPAVIHLQFGGETGHISAITEGSGASTRLVDHPLRLDALIENKTINAQASGYFMVPAGMPLPDGFIVASAGELQNVIGRTSCPTGSDDEGCNPPKGPCGGMAVATVSRFLPGLIVQDEPLTYQPLYGPAVNFRLEYRQVQLHGEDTTSETSNLGPLWNHGFVSYVKAGDDSALPGTAAARVFFDGTYFEYARSGASYVARYVERPALAELTVAQGGPGYRLTFHDGPFQDFTQPNGPAPTRYYLTKITASQGYSTTLGYDTLLRLANVTDATGRVTTLTCAGSDLKIQTISDPFGRTASFAYDAQGRLESITDAIGIVSSFTYDQGSPERIVSLTTPYGTTQIAYDNPAAFSFSVNSSVTLTNPEGFASRAEYFYHDGNTPFTAGANPESRPTTNIMVDSTLCRS